MPLQDRYLPLYHSAYRHGFCDGVLELGAHHLCQIEPHQSRAD